MCSSKILPADYQRTSLPWWHDDVLWEVFPRTIRPFDAAPIVRVRKDLEFVRADQWSLTPPWSKTLRTKYATFNARLDSLTSKATWRSVFPKNRCLVPAAGFFERGPEPGAKKKRPYYVRYKDERTFCFAGLWSEWVNKETGEVSLTYSILTTENNALMDRIGHHRMPCIVDERNFEYWLDPQETDAEALIASVESPVPASELKCHPVSYAINFRSEDGPEVTEPIGEEIVVDVD